MVLNSMHSCYQKVKTLLSNTLAFLHRACLALVFPSGAVALNTPARHGPVVDNSQAGMHCGIESLFPFIRSLHTKNSKLATRQNRSGMQEMHCYIYDQSTEENGVEGSLPPSSNQVHIKFNINKTAIGFGFKEKATTGL